MASNAQWGYKTTGSGEQSITFPLSFQNQCLQAIPVSSGSGTYENWGFLKSDTPTKTTFKIWSRENATFRYLAVGY